jgi:ABC-type Fe3+ transport system substrate-binding protein
LQDQLKPMIDAVPNFSTLGLDPALVMANTRTSTAEIGLLPESQWLAHFQALSDVDALQLYYPERYILLNFPYAIWEGPETTSAERQAAQAFGRFLLSDSQQAALGALGIRPATRQDVGQFGPFQAAAGQVQTELTGSQITPADRPATLALLRWFRNFRPAS